MSRIPFFYPPILTYHRIAPTLSDDTPTVTLERFERQMEILSTGWRPIPLSKLVDWLDGKRPLPARTVVVTFDDGEEGIFTHAFPILCRYRIPATVFLVASHVGKPGSLSLNQIRKMQEEGISFGSHTLSHAYLPSHPLGQVEQELRLSREALRLQGISADFLSYPAGGFTEEILPLVRQAGYRAACTTNRGLKRFPIDRWALRRITMHQPVASSLGMWLRCCGFYGLNRRLRAPS